MFRGGTEPAPYPLGGTGSEEGISPEQYSRICADLVAAQRTLPIAVLGINGTTGALTFFLSRFGVGTSSEAAPTTERLAAGNYKVTFTNQIQDEAGNDRSLTITHAIATSSTSLRFAVVDNVDTSVVDIETRVYGGVASEANFTIEVFGTWGDLPSIGAYGGSLSKKSDTKEHPAPYVAQIYRDLQSQRGSAYTTKPDTWVHVENLTIARQKASTDYRLPQKLQNNASGPQKADEGLDYWARSLGLQMRPNETTDEFRSRAALFRRLSKGGTYDNVRDEVSTLLGDAFVGVTFNHDDNFETPPTNTYWPTINPGPDAYNIGGGAWLSERAQVIIEAQQPGGMPDGEFSQLMNNDLFELVDRLIPAWCTAQWQDADAIRIVWDGAGVTWDGAGITWDNLYDWNS